MKVTAFLVVAALLPDGGSSFNESLYSDCPVRDPLGIVRDDTADGGTLEMSAVQSRRASCLVETCEDRRLTLEPVAREVTWRSWVFGITVSFFIGAVVSATLTTYALHRAGWLTF